MDKRSTGVLCGILVIAAVAISWTRARSEPTQEPQQPPARAPGTQMPDLPAGILATPGCLGVETGRMASGKQSIFAWFESKAAVRKWYYSEMHQGVMEAISPGIEIEHGPLEHVADDEGPILVIATLTMSDEPHFKEMPELPISQISIELYKPLPGGAYLGGRLAPDTVKVEHMEGLAPPVND